MTVEWRRARLSGSEMNVCMSTNGFVGARDRRVGARRTLIVNRKAVCDWGGHCTGLHRVLNMPNRVYQRDLSTGGTRLSTALASITKTVPIKLQSIINTHTSIHLVFSYFFEFEFNLHVCADVISHDLVNLLLRASVTIQ